ncbi:MAG TPA: RIP metalloprotease RseP [Kofleriaceae bacterium]|nr:RIP metalloprotease RseP [Kofleriaceae bacterium]
MAVLYFLVLVGVLVVIHEFGHFVAAKLLDFKVTRFSIGFGQPLVRVRRGETEYQIALFPIGGYVRILGEDPSDEVPPEDARRAFNVKPLWQRLLVVFAGPAANFLLPVVIYFVSFAGHTELPAAVIGDVVAGSPAARAGFEPGDRVLSIDGDPVRYWEDVERIVDRRIGRQLRFRLRRGTRTLERDVAPVEIAGRTGDGKPAREGWIGITQAAFPPQVGVLDPASPAGLATLRTGDRIAGIDGHRIDTWTELRRDLEGAPRVMRLAHFRARPVRGLGIVLYEPDQTSLAAEQTFGHRAGVEHGLHPADLFVDRVEPGSPAARAGIRPGDLLTSLDGEPIPHWLVLERRLRGRPDHTFRVTWRRAGVDEEMTAAVRQEHRTRTDEYGNRSDTLVFGAAPRFDRGQGEMIEIDGRLRYAATRSVERAFEAIGVMASGLGSILLGKNPSEVGGPIMMFQVAAASGRQGWEALFFMIALVSISVGLINLLPVPVLDGGHILVFALEAVRGRPLSARARARITLVGLAVVGLITILALRNDLVRYIM